MGRGGVCVARGGGDVSSVVVVLGGGGDCLGCRRFQLVDLPPVHFLTSPTPLSVSTPQIEAKTRKITRMWGKLQSAQQELRDTVAEFQVERDDMLETIRLLSRQLKQRTAVLDHFVAPEDAELVRRWSGRRAQGQASEVRDFKAH